LFFRGKRNINLKFLNQNWGQFRLFYVRRPIDTAGLTMYTYSPGPRARHEIRGSCCYGCLYSVKDNLTILVNAHLAQGQDGMASLHRLVAFYCTKCNKTSADEPHDTRSCLYVSLCKSRLQLQWGQLPAAPRVSPITVFVAIRQCRGLLYFQNF